MTPSSTRSWRSSRRGLSPGELHRFVGAGIEQNEEALRLAPRALRDFFKNLQKPPWLYYEGFRPGVRAFHENVDLMLTAFVTGVLVEGFSTLIAKSFGITGRVATTRRRLQQNNRHMMEIFFPCRPAEKQRGLEAIHAHSVRSHSHTGPAGEVG